MRWGASDPVLIADTKTSRVARVSLPDGRPAVVKQLKPVGVVDELRGADYLEWRDGMGAVRMIEREGTTLLLEDAGSRTLLDYLQEHGDDAATSVGAAVLTALQSPSPRPLPAALEPLERWFGSLFAMASRGDSLLADGAEAASALLADQRDRQPLHGDLHHENILVGERGWLAIDAKGLVGDPAYDAGNFFCNPLDRDDLRLNPARIRSMASLLGSAVQREPAAVLWWAFAHACLSGSWHLEDGEHERAAGSLRVAAAIRSVLAG